MRIGDCSLNIFFNIIIYRKGRIITTVEIEPPTPQNFEKFSFENGQNNPTPFFIPIFTRYLPWILE